MRLRRPRTRTSNARCFPGTLRGVPPPVEYAAQASRYRPILWSVASSPALVPLDLLTLRLLYEEQGDGAVFVEQGAQPLFANPSIYGYSDEGRNEVRKAERLFVQTARALFGTDASMTLAA